MKNSLLCGGLAAAMLFIYATPRLARVQSQAPAIGPLAFEVASIKPNTSGLGSSSTNSSNGLLRITNQTLQSMIQYAYNVRDFQISGGPGRMRTDRYDVIAKAEKGAHDQQTKQMLQTLLTERFQLQFHPETRDGAVYALLVGKNGPKLTSAKDTGSSGSSGGRNAETGQSTLTVKGVNIDGLAADLAARLGRPVVNKTDLTGKFDFELSWVPDMVSDVSGPSIFTAVQEQLGFRLESQKGPVETLVIDRAEKPLL